MILVKLDMFSNIHFHSKTKIRVNIRLECVILSTSHILYSHPKTSLPIQKAILPLTNIRWLRFTN